MRILFIGSGNRSGDVSIILRNQGDSLSQLGHEVDFYAIVGKNLSGYVKNIRPIHNKIENGQYDIIHTHYALAALITTFARAKPIVVSLMGSDIRISPVINIIIRFLHRFFWKVTVMKSSDMVNALRIKNVEIIPNGVNVDRFIPLGTEACKNLLGWDLNKKHILFGSDPQRPEKNFTLAKETVNILDEKFEIELHLLKNIPNEIITNYYNAADLLLLTSKWEGSPNVIKEAMACNCPIVSTNVGDVGWVIYQIEGCYITTNKPDDIAKAIQHCFIRNKRTKGRARIMELGLDSNTIAQRLIKVYSKIHT